MKLAGRDREAGEIAAAFESSAAASSMLTITAPAGSGKSALLRHAADAIDGHGVRVLRCRPTESERGLDYSALGDLLEPIDDLGLLGPADREVLDAVLLRAPVEHGVTARAVGAACVRLWAALASEPLVVCVDDLQWVDAASMTALRFSWRRLPPGNVFVLAARRGAAGEPNLDAVGVEMVLGPLDDSAILQILSDRSKGSGHALAPSTRRAIVTAAAGVPLFAVELARMSEDTASPGPGIAATMSGPLRVPPSLAALIEQRWGTMPADSVAALAPIALASRPDLALADRLGVGADVELAEGKGFVDTADREIRFTHPLLAAALIDRLTASQRRAAHRRLAAAVTDPVEAVRHAGLGAQGTDDELAAALSAASKTAVARAANDTAAELARLAADVGSTASAEHSDRLLAAALLTFQCGDTVDALSLLDRLDTTAPDRTPTAGELLVRARILFSVESGSASQRSALAALDASATDREQAEAHALLARIIYDHFPTAAGHARAALELAERIGAGPAVLASALVARGGTACMAGEGLDRSLYDRAIALERGHVSYAGDSAYASLAALLRITDELDESRRMFEVILADHDEGALPYALSHLPQLELWSGNWDLAEDYAHRHLEAATRLGQAGQVIQARTNLATIDAYRGNTESAAALAAEQVSSGATEGVAWDERNGYGMLGFVALAAGDAERAVTMLGRWQDLGDRMGLGEPGYCRYRADHVEALLATGRLDEAEQRAAVMRADADRLDRLTLHGAADRVEALIAATKLDREAAVRLGRRAVETMAQTPLVVDHARAQLSLGQIHRRFKEKTAARDALRSALTTFERLGAERFAERARQDMSRLGLRPSRGSGLTDTERQVALLAATGRTVRQVADELFVSPKTVESNLTRVYRKLGLSGRAELAVWATRQSAVGR